MGGQILALSVLSERVKGFQLSLTVQRSHTWNDISNRASEVTGSELSITAQTGNEQVFVGCFQTMLNQCTEAAKNTHRLLAMSGRQPRNQQGDIISPTYMTAVYLLLQEHM